MEWLSKIGNPLAERAKSPLYGAFVSSWLIWNWRIVLTIILPNQSKFGKQSLVEYISTHFVNNCDCLLIPLILALLYVFALPYIDLQLISFTEKRKREKIDKKIDIGRKHKVEGDIYFNLKLKFEEERKKIIESDNENSELKLELAKSKNANADLSLQLVNSQNSFERVDKPYQELLKRHDINTVFQGRWTLNFVDSTNPSFNGIEEIEIRGHEYIIIRNNTESHAFDIMLPDFDIARKKFSFVKYNLIPGQDRGHCITDLRIISNDRFEGSENKIIKVTYERRKFTN